MMRRELKINGGGLLRCCVLSASEWIEAQPDAEVAQGEKIACHYEKSNEADMVVDQGVIRWFDPDYPPLTGVME